MYSTQNTNTDHGLEVYSGMKRLLGRRGRQEQDVQTHYHRDVIVASYNTQKDTTIGTCIRKLGSSILMQLKGGQPRLKEKVAADGNIWHTDMVTILVAGKFCHPKKKTSALSSIGMIIMHKFAWMDNEFSKCIFKDVRVFFFGH